MPGSERASERCRSCGSEPLDAVLSLGNMPLANALLTEEQLDEPEPRYPLDLAFCSTCSLVQITETVPPEAMFFDYPYMSSCSRGTLGNAGENVKGVLASRDLGADSLVIEVGSNDGYLLQFYAQRGIPVLGIDPAQNIAKLAEERGIRTLCDFFGMELARRLAAEGRRADVIHMNNTLAHIADLNGVVAGVAMLLKDDGVAIIEVPYVKELIERVEFDTIYHEHLCYFSVTAVEELLRRHGLVLADAKQLPIHGGSLRIFARRRGKPSWQARQLLAQEADEGMGSIGFYRDFGAKVERLADALRHMLRQLKARGKTLVGYAASAKGATLLNYCGIGRETLDFVVDNIPAKQGRYTPGTHLLICPPERLLEEMPEYALLLAWNHADEIVKREAEYRRRGGRFIVPVPRPAVLPAQILAEVIDG